jgi:DNA-binding MarR family transcriptional regulator
MSRNTRGNAAHRRGADRVLGALRAFGADVDRMDGTVATHLGLNRSDLRVMELLNRSGTLPAGEVAKATGLTTAAVTTVIDRLANRGFVVRRDDPLDRRRVLVAPTAQANAASDALFAELLHELRESLVSYSDEELDTILSFLTDIRAVFARRMER